MWGSPEDLCIPSLPAKPLAALSLHTALIHTTLRPTTDPPSSPQRRCDRNAQPHTGILCAPHSCADVAPG